MSHRQRSSQLWYKACFNKYRKLQQRPVGSEEGGLLCGANGAVFEDAVILQMSENASSEITNEMLVGAVLDANVDKVLFHSCHVLGGLPSAETSATPTYEG